MWIAILLWVLCGIIMLIICPLDLNREAELLEDENLKADIEFHKLLWGSKLFNFAIWIMLITVTVIHRPINFYFLWRKRNADS